MINASIYNNDVESITCICQLIARVYNICMMIFVKVYIVYDCVMFSRNDSIGLAGPEPTSIYIHQGWGKYVFVLKYTDLVYC